MAASVAGAGRAATIAAAEGVAAEIRHGVAEAAAAAGWIDEQGVALESLLAIKRAGADMILTYFAKDACRWLA